MAGRRSRADPVASPLFMIPSPSLLPRAWLVVGLLWLVGCLNYLDRVMITTMRGSLTEAIPMTDAQFGLLDVGFFVGLWSAQSLCRFPRRPVQPLPRHHRQPFRLVSDHLDDGPRHHLQRTAAHAGADGSERSLLHSSRPCAHRRLSPRIDPFVRDRPAHERHHGRIGLGWTRWLDRGTPGLGPRV